ncbi:hypothetical protein GCM10009555_043780 [Acrocarpospora macrocephala]|uniref:Uncharacterized protein n=1 Tax=Acrocarpospora macrocephala TaxID=150177 RepID=A0A5M3WF58_9ACTN|nr:hypothetical protein [Acrocarpospora macrocephala]GES06959.1 hypothetical protein Amac_005540 [Acrocarpospora macrocephala]
MTIPPDEYGDLLRRAMRAEADSVVPSPEGLNIIRQRIENRGFNGLRNIFWWRIGASVAAAALVAGTVVMVVPGLREQVETNLTTGNESGQVPEIGATNQPPPPPPTAPLTILPATPSVPGEVPAQSTATAPPSPTPAAATPDPCASPTTTPTVVEPEPTNDEDCPPDETPAPNTPSPKPSPSETPTPSPSPTPSGCSGDGCSTTPTPLVSSGPATESASGLASTT